MVASQPAKQVRTDRVKQVIAVELQSIDYLESRSGPDHLGHRDGPVQGHDRPRGERRELVIEREDLSPIGVLGTAGIAVDRVDRCLDLVGAGLGAPQAFAHQRLPLGDQLAIPAAAVLICEEHKVALQGGPSLPPRFDQQHQGEEPLDLGLVGHQLGEHTSEPDRLRTEIFADEILPGGG